MVRGSAAAGRRQPGTALRIVEGRNGAEIRAAGLDLVGS